MKPEAKKSGRSRQRDQRLASWIFGSLLLLFAMNLLLWGPDSLPAYKHRLLGILCALLAGLFTYFLLGTATFLPNRIPVKATSGVAVFLIVLWWWSGPNAPVKVDNVQTSDLGATVRFQFMNELEDGDAERFAHLIPDDTTLTLRFARSALTEPPETWSTPSADLDRKESVVTATSANFSSGTERFPSTDGPYIVPVRRFDRFVGDLREFESGALWDAGFLQAYLESKADEVAAVNHFQSKADEFQRKGFDEQYRVSSSLREQWSTADYAVAALPITADIEVTIAGKPVWIAKGWLARVWEHDEDVRLLIVARFPSARISKKDPPES